MWSCYATVFRVWVVFLGAMLLINCSDGSGHGDDNREPVALDDLAATNQGRAVAIAVTDNDYDPDGTIAAGSVAIHTPSAYGSVRVSRDGQVEYAPSAEYFGEDHFGYIIKDNLGAESNEAEVTIRVNALPVANDDVLRVHQGEAVMVDVAANDFDADGVLDPGSIRITHAPAHGAAMLTAAGQIEYLPAAEYFGDDTFAYTIDDDLGARSSEGWVAVSVNAAPVAVADSVASNGGAPVMIDLLANDSDPDGALDPGTLTIVDYPRSGEAVIHADGSALYTPDSSFNGMDTFTYTVQDTEGAVSQPVLVTISFNALPVAVPDSGVTNHGSPVTIDVVGNDTDADGAVDPGSVQILSGPEQGRATVYSDGTVDYLPATGFYGTDSFTYQVLDDRGALSNAAKVSIRINVPPSAVPGCWHTPQEVVLSGRLRGNDSDDGSEGLSFSLLDPPRNGQITSFDPKTGDFDYAPYGWAQRGRDSFSYRVEDPLGASGTGVESIIVDPRVMPLGDSITFGYLTATTTPAEEYVTGYRQPLYLALRDAGYHVDFVGGLASGQSAAPSFDADHEGHGGWRDDQVADNVFSWLGNYPADVVLLHIGTNGLDASPADVDDILNEIDRFSEETTVVLARIINRQQYSAMTTAFNDNVEAVARQRIAAGDRIILVDMESALTYPDDMADQWHPNQLGYEKMAEVWFRALTDPMVRPQIVEKCP